MEEILVLLQIIRNYIKNENIPINDKVDETKLYKVANLHSVSHFLQSWANDNATKELKDKVNMDFNGQILKDTNQGIEFENLLNKLEEENVKTLVFKGFLTKSLYPQSYMRKMCDIDILVEKQNIKKAGNIIKKQGFEELDDREKHKCFVKQILIIIELHREMLNQGDIGYKYFKNILEKAVNYKDYKNIYQMDLEDNYIFSIVHLIEHFKLFGINIRDVLDVYLFNEKNQDLMNYEKLDKVFEELGIKEFEKQIREIAYKWFDGNQIIKKEEFSEVEKYIISGPSYNKGVIYSSIENKNDKNVVFRLFFPTLHVMQNQYHILGKAPFLLPFMWIYRLIKGMFEKSITWKERFRKIDVAKNTNKGEIEEVKEIYRKLGI